MNTWRFEPKKLIRHQEEPLDLQTIGRNCIHGQISKTNKNANFSNNYNDNENSDSNNDYNNTLNNDINSCSNNDNNDNSSDNKVNIHINNYKENNIKTHNIDDSMDVINSMQ